MIIALGSDHGGFLYKEKLIVDLKEQGYDIIDCGAYDQEMSDYPVFAGKVAETVQKKAANYGVVLCTSGEGVCIMANKYKGIRCGIGYNDEVSKALRIHNHANMITFGAKYMDYEDVLRRIILFVNQTEEGGRHDRRVQLINEIDK